MEYHGLSGQVLTSAEKAAIQVSFVLLSKDAKGTVKFWGRISGAENDYLICQKGTEDVFTNSTFYSIDGGLTWMLLPPTTEVQADYCRQLRGVFLGNPQYEYKIEEPVPEVPPPEEKVEVEAEPPAEDAEGDQEAEADEEQDDEEEKPDEEEEKEEEKEEEAEAAEDEPEAKPAEKKKKTRIVSIQETVRLAYFVEQVDYNCSTVPRGAYLLNESDTVIPNKFFEGLSDHDAGKLSSYCHTRHMAGGKGEDCFDFMDTIDQDVPKGVWTLKFEPIMGLVVGSNLLYPGFTFYHKPGTTVYGQYYFGDGQQNFDLCFML
jgi:radial spoke head protein 9|mmetsp:Transcript_65215/g.108312  ORF Transcript_65215/g.108312 Transcript_65215/m.108312 type:complete len:318 (+) Transcript_65215:54-1007(+)